MLIRLLSAAALSAVLAAPIALAQTTLAPATSAPPASPQTETPAATAPAAPAPRATTTPHPPATLSAGQYRTEAEAKTRCAADVVVWVNKETKVIHLSSSRSYGKTKTGAYMCQKNATAAGFHAPRPPRPATPKPQATTTTSTTTAPASTEPAATPNR